MPRYIDIDETVKTFEKLHGEESTLLNCYNADWIVSFLEAQPTADVVEVVRCKDCKRCYEKRTKRGNQLMRFCMRMDGNEYQVNANDFCSYGTPKERGGEK